MIAVHNQADADVTDYPIEDPETKEVHLWSIKAGQTLKFPDYVGNYLLEVYGFLQEVMTKEEKEARDREKARVDAGKVYSQVKIIDKKPKNDPKEAEGLTSQDVDPENATQLPPNLQQA